jgi:hypothetical protein
MTRRSRWAPLAVAACILGCGPSDSRTADIQMRANPGETFRTEFELNSRYFIGAPALRTFPTGGEQLRVKLIKEHKCLKSGGGQWEWQIRGVDAEAGGTGSMLVEAAALAESEKAKSETLVRDKQNRGKENKPTSAFDPVYPNRPVHIGDSWRSEVVMQGVTLPLVYTFSAFDEVNGRPAALLTAKPENSRVILLEAPLKLWIDLERGVPIKGEVEFVYEPQTEYKVLTKMTLKEAGIGSKGSDQAASTATSATAK